MKDDNERSKIVPDESKDSSKYKKEYLPPQLREYGRVSDLTMSGRRGNNNDGPARTANRMAP